MRARITLTILVLAALALSGSAAVFATQRDGGERDAVASATGDLDAVRVRSFADFPLYSVGSRFEGLPLTAVMRRADDPYPGERRADYVSFLYGDCDAGDHLGCPLPLEVQVWPACERTLSDYTLTPAGDPLSHERLRVGGVPAALFEDGLRLELYTGEVTVVVFGLDRERVRRAAEALRGVNATVSAHERLPQPVAGAMEGALACGSR